jgi:Uncharacterized ACR, COG1430.
VGSSFTLPKTGTYCGFKNETKNTILAERAIMARSFFSRLKGLLGTLSLPSGQGLLLEPCNGIHMLGMLYAIDAVFIDKQGVVVGLVERIPPFALSKTYKKAQSCLELSLVLSRVLVPPVVTKSHF